MHGKIPCMCSKRLSYGVFQLTSNLKKIARFPMDPNTVYVLESRLISMDGATQIPISEFEAST